MESCCGPWISAIRGVFAGRSNGCPARIAIRRRGDLHGVISELVLADREGEAGGVPADLDPLHDGGAVLDDELMAR